eukprot:TRINITY_DN734_c7_g1_i1.p1 TRINITY_DN734_c7_g1~~TRINITY_DN734_c7_g1_i1.p1  ORF type:complete len:282 (+),score=43.20 TRINITY_DN734_c7_g1_i1:37-846(+)
MDGHLFPYNKRLVAMRSGSEWSDKILVHIAGLTDGLLSCPWAVSLAASVSKIGWTFVQPIISSSYLGYGTSSLDTDSEDLKALINEIKTLTPVSQIVLLGHSTGCQNSVHFVRKYPTEGVTKVILQGAVSDREYLATLDETDEYIKLAREMMTCGKGDELMPRKADKAAITAARYLSLADVGGADDMFSTDLSDAKLSSLLTLPIPALVVLSESDEYTPPGYDVATAAKRLSTALGDQSSSLIIPSGNHAISSTEGQEVFINAVVSFLS